MNSWEGESSGREQIFESIEDSAGFVISSTELGEEMDKNKAGVLNKSLAVSLIILESRVGRKEVEEVIEIICDPEFDVKLFSKQVGCLDDCNKITAEIVRKCRDRKWGVVWIRWKCLSEYEMYFWLCYLFVCSFFFNYYKIK